MTMYSHSGSPTSSTSSLSSSSSNKTTNTIAITCLPRTFFAQDVQDVLRSHFETYGHINQWVPLAGFGRVIVVYESHDSAESARERCSGVQLPSDDGQYIPLKVYRADPNPLRHRTEDGTDAIPKEFYLAPPSVEKNFLISPPGSPPVGWEPIQEDPPNSTPLAEDLMTALRKLQLQENTRSDDGLEILLHPDEAGVGVYVEDCDASVAHQPDDIKEEDWIYGETNPARAKWKPIPTAMPPTGHAIAA